MSALLYCVQEIRNTIPHEVLVAGMTADDKPALINITSLDDKILNKVIKKRVLFDTNLVGGQQVLVPIAQSRPMHYEDYFTVYFIDKKLTLNREIVSVLSLTDAGIGNTFGTPTIGSRHITSGGNCYTGHGPLSSMAARIGDAASIGGSHYNAHVELVGPNTVLVQQNYQTLRNLALKCVIENEGSFNNIQPRSWPNLAQLCIWAVKAYIYNKLIISMGSGVLSGGQELGVFKSIVDDYSEAEENYKLYLEEKWAKVSMINDVSRYNKFLGSMLQPDL